jgi:hypothetical protein
VKIFVVVVVVVVVAEWRVQFLPRWVVESLVAGQRLKKERSSVEEK